MFGRYDEDFDSTLQTDGTKLLTEAVYKQLPVAGLTPFSEVAEYLNEVPWDVLMVCRHLVRSELAHEGMGKQRGSFGRL